jgi:serine/threonine-protein kinase
MPPEQARGLHTELDARSDVWSVGAIMFTTLTGRRVHEAATAEERLALAAGSHAGPLEATARAQGLDLDLEPRVAAVIDRALAFEKDRRWPSAIEMRHAYWLASGREESSLPPLERRRRSHASVPAFAPASVAPSSAPAPVPPPVPIAPVIPAEAKSPQPDRPSTPRRGIFVLLVLLLLVVGLAFRFRRLLFPTR